MNKNQIFSWNRFVALMRNDLIINLKSYLWLLLGAVVVGTIIMYIQMPHNAYYVHYEHNRYFSTFFMSLFVIAGVVGSSFPELKNKINFTRYLMLPASNFEKYVSQFFIRIVLAVPLFLLIFYVDAHLARQFSFWTYQGTTLPLIDSFSYFKLIDSEMHIPSNDFWLFVNGVFGLGMFLFAMRLFFKRVPIVKVVFTLVILFYFIAALMIAGSMIFYPELTNFVRFNVHIPTYDTGIFGLNNNELFFHIIFTITWLFVLPLGYFKLKEKQL